MSVKRYFTRELQRARARGATIVCSLQPYLDREVVYRPRQGSDPQPWVFRDGPAGFRYSGRECHAIVPPPSERVSASDRFVVVARAEHFVVVDTKANNRVVASRADRDRALDRAYALNHPEREV